MSVFETKNEIKDSKAAIKKVEEEIEKVEEEINEADSDEKKQLREKEFQLRKGKEQLNEEKEQLNDRLNILLKQQNDAFNTLKIADGEFYATTEELWDWKQENWSQALAQLCRAEPPKVYSDLAQAIHASETSDSIPGDSLSAQTLLVSCVKVLNDADFSIFGNPACKGHQIPKSKTCRPFYGPVAEIATGLDLSNDDDRQKKWRRLLWGGTKPTDTDGHGFVGLEKRAENFVVINNPHRGLYDTLEDGVLAKIPICNAKFSSEWQQVRDYDLLVVANSAQTYHAVNMNTGSRSARFHREASIEDIRKATNFLGICIKALAQILASESNMLLGPMEEVLNKNYDGERQNKRNRASRPDEKQT